MLSNWQYYPFVDNVYDLKIRVEGASTAKDRVRVAREWECRSECKERLQLPTQPFQRAPLLAWHFISTSNLQSLRHWQFGNISSLIVTVALAISIITYTRAHPLSSFLLCKITTSRCSETKVPFSSHRCSCIVAFASASASSSCSSPFVQHRSGRRQIKSARFLYIPVLTVIHHDHDQYMPSLLEQTMGCFNRLVSKLRRSWRRSSPRPPPLNIVSLL